jgi:hypothetical protein
MKFVIVRHRQVDAYSIEYYTAITYFLREAGHSVIHTTWEGIPYDYDVVLYFHSGFYSIPEGFDITEGRIVLMNIEQMSRKDYRDFTINLLNKYPNMLYADYSTANIALVEEQVSHIRGIWMPYFHNPAMKPPSTEPRKTDLLFFGCMSHERASLCKKYGATVITAFMDERDAAIRKAKCILNCHYSKDYKIFESLRAYHSVYLGTPVFTADESYDETCFLSERNQAYLLKALPVPDDLPELDFTEEDRKAKTIISHFINLFRPSSPTPTDLCSSDNH